MKSLTPWRKKRPEGAKGGDMVPLEDFAFSLSRMRDEFDRLFERLARDFAALNRFSGEGWRWGLELQDEDDRVVVRAEAPGFEPGDFDIRVEDSRLSLRASKKIETRDEKGKVQEVREQECFESIDLPSGIDKDKVDAKYQNGVLTVALPKTAAGKAKRVAVKAG